MCSRLAEALEVARPHLTLDPGVSGCSCRADHPSHGVAEDEELAEVVQLTRAEHPRGRVITLQEL